MSDMPSFLTNMALFYQGSNRTKFEKVTLPTFKRKVEVKRFPGTSHPQAIDMGPDGAIELVFSGPDLDSDILAAFGLCPGDNGVRVHLKSVFKPIKGCKKVLHEIKANGFWEEVNMGDQQIGETSDRSYKLTCDYFQYIRDGVVIKEVDANAPDEEERKLLGL